MKNLKVSDILGIVNKIAPPELAESWDNSGLQLGEPNAEINRIMVALDPTPAVVDSALAASCQLLITHHPLIFRPQKNISTGTSQGRLIYTAIRGGLAIISIHTSYDIAEDGLNDLLAARLGLSECLPLQITTSQELVKLAVFVPETHLDQVRRALLPLTERLGSYSDCSFAAPGEGTFTPLEGAAPFIGSIGVLEQVREQRVEFLISRNNLARAIKTLLAAHPYQEPAFDIYPLLNTGKKLGLGRIGRLSEPTTLAAFATTVANRLQTKGLRYVGAGDRQINKVALCSGSGASFLNAAVRAGADCLVTGDVKYHEAREAEDLGITLIDAGHFPSEQIMVAEVTGRLEQILVKTGYSDCHVLPCTIEQDPFKNVWPSEE
ncbi:MAG TPA: Nif3-like dinuclear metal center hexameric protein [Desulfuromonadaceae bacterium]|jgi:dinuclear metal center YbgI/SA1388 family protein